MNQDEQERIQKFYDEFIKTDQDPRYMWDYFLSKVLVDYRLLNKIDIRGKNILNVGCSYPIDEILFVSRVKRWTAIDISKESVRAARAIAKHELPKHFFKKISFIEADAASLPFKDESFDVTLCFSTIDHIPGAQKRQKTCQEISRVTKKGGYAIITVPNKQSIFYYLANKREQKNKTTLWYEHCFSPRELMYLMKTAGFEILDFQSTLSGRTGARGLVLAIGLGVIEKYILQWLGRRMGYLGYKTLALSKQHETNLYS